MIEKFKRTLEMNKYLSGLCVVSFFYFSLPIQSPQISDLKPESFNLNVFCILLSVLLSLPETFSKVLFSSSSKTYSGLSIILPFTYPTTSVISIVFLDLSRSLER